MSNKCPKCHHENPDDTLFCGKCGAQLPSPEDIEVTETIESPKEELTTGSTFAGRYQIIEELGKGGMGKIYKVHDTKIKEKIALKLIKPEIAKDKKTLERFRNELKFARKIRHKNICQMFDLGEDRGTHFITMEFVEGQDLKKLIRQSGQLAIGTTIKIAKQVCDGLAEAHTSGVVHRDLKPSNIMIDDDGNARIMDFGIARSLEAKGITGAGVMIGTPEYMSPEQVEGKDVDQRSDVYSLGIILYEMTTGRVPFEGDTPFTIGMKHKGEMPQNPKELNTQIPEDLSRVVLRCLKKEKDKRYQSAGEVRSELASIESGLPTTEKVIPKRKPLTSKEITVTFDLKKLFLPALFIVTLILIALIFWHPWSKKGAVPIPSDKPSLAVMYFKNNTGDESLDFWRSALSDSIITDLSQSKFIRVLNTDSLYSILERLDLLEAKNYSSKDLKKVAVEGGVNHILQGGISKAGDNFRIEYRLQEIDKGEIIGSDRVEGIGQESIFTMVDEITTKIKKDLKLTQMQIADDIDRDLGKITTSSPEAYKYYIEGERLHFQHKYNQAIESFKKALEFDPEFAMAHRNISTCYWNLGEYEKQRTYLQKAIIYKENLPPREYFLLQGDLYSLREETWDKSVEMYKKILEIYPEDFLGYHMVAYMYGRMGELDKAINYNERLLQIGTQERMIYSNLFWWYWSKGEYAKGKQILVDFLDNVREDPGFRMRLIWIHIIDGKFDLGLKECEKYDYWNSKTLRYWIYYFQDKFNLIHKAIQDEWDSKEDFPLFTLFFMRCLYMTQGNMQKAIALAKTIIKEMQLNERSMLALYVDLGILYLSTKRPEPALEAFSDGISNLNISESALSSGDSLWENESGCLRILLFWQTVAYTMIGELTKAEEMLGKIEQITPPTSKNAFQNMIFYLKGKIALERNEYLEAIENLKMADSSIYKEWVYYPLDRYRNIFPGKSYHHAFYLNDLALAYYKAGELDKSRLEYEKIISLTIHRYLWGDIYAKSFYMLGKIHEQQGNKAKAIEHYEKFLSLWKDADPGLVEVEDARKRLAALTHVT
jgi:serine/threonine protein kinase